MSWISTNKASGGPGADSINITASNNTGAARTGRVILKNVATNESRTVELSQALGLATYVNSFESISYRKTTKWNQVVPVKTDGAWTASSDQLWCQLVSTSGAVGDNLVFNITSEATTTRSAYITLNANGNTHVVQVNQNATQDYNNTPYGFIVDNSDWTIPIALDGSSSWTFSNTADFASISGASPSGSSTLNINVHVPVNSTGSQRYDDTVYQFISSSPSFMATLFITQRT